MHPKAFRFITTSPTRTVRFTNLPFHVERELMHVRTRPRTRGEDEKFYQINSAISRHLPLMDANTIPTRGTVAIAKKTVSGSLYEPRLTHASTSLGVHPSIHIMLSSLSRQYESRFMRQKTAPSRRGKNLAPRTHGSLPDLRPAWLRFVRGF